MSTTTDGVASWGGIRPVARKVASDTPDHTPQLARPDDWTKQANCLDDWKAFAGEGREPSKEVAEALCAGCPVIDICLSKALEEEGTVAPSHRGGIRGGKTPSQRYEMRERASERIARRPLGKGLSHPLETCPEDHARAMYGWWDGKRWRCSKCREIADSQIATCTCGKVARRNTIATHRRRKGCA